MTIYKITYMADARAEEAKEIAKDLGGKVFSLSRGSYNGRWVVRFPTLEAAEEWAKDFDICHWGNRNDIEVLV